MDNDDNIIFGGNFVTHIYLHTSKNGGLLKSIFKLLNSKKSLGQLKILFVDVRFVEHITLN